MAAEVKSEPKMCMEIKTKSVEETLIPLVTQITTLVNHRERPQLSERSHRALVLVGQTVNQAVERFVSVGERIAVEHDEIRREMCQACGEARLAGASIQSLTDSVAADNSTKSFTEKNEMVRSARQLLSAITKVLLLADKVIVKQILSALDSVSHGLDELERVTTFTDFVQVFSNFGTYMVEMAHLSGDRQNDLKSDTQRAQMGAARSVLEKSTMMLLTACKTTLRHPESASAQCNLDGVFLHMREALSVIRGVLSSTPTDPPHSPANGHPPTVNGHSQVDHTASAALKHFQDLVEVCRVTSISSKQSEDLQSSFHRLIEISHDFTDSAYTSHQDREKILELCETLSQELDMLLVCGCDSALDLNGSSPIQQIETSILKTCDVLKLLRRQLQDTALEHASELFKTNDDHELLSALKTTGITGEIDAVDEICVKFSQHSDQIDEVCKLLCHMSTSEPLMITAQHIQNVVKSITPLTQFAAQTLAQNPSSKIARENLDVFSDSWETQINELSALVKDINDVCQGKMDKHVYLSLPRPGKHGTTSKSLRPVKLDAEEQARIAKLGLEMKLITSEMEAETDKWEDSENVVVKRAKNMSSMAFSMYLFTRGEGPLKTTQDLFTQAEYFAEEGNKLFKVIRDFLTKIPLGAPRDELAQYTERIPNFCQQLHITLKSPTFGKAATFNKVDSAIQETKNLMNVIAKVVTTCFICATKYAMEYRLSPIPTQRWHTDDSPHLSQPPQLSPQPLPLSLQPHLDYQNRLYATENY